jgi:hypothetical protein
MNRSKVLNSNLFLHKFLVNLDNFQCPFCVLLCWP